MPFLSPALLWFLALASAPLIIHLLNRRRFLLIDWAPMKYLKLTIRNNRRRLRIEQLLLLLLRTLIVIAVVMAIARPTLSRTGWGRWLSRSSRLSRVIVLDDSLSMGYRHEGRTALDRGKSAAAEILRSTGAQDAVTFLGGAPALPPLVHEASLQDPAKLIVRIDSLQPTEAACDWAAVFKTVDDALASATYPQKEVVLITDLRRAGWNGQVAAFAQRWAKDGVEMRIIDVGCRDTVNTSLPRFVQEDAVILPGIPAKLTASIRNATTSAITSAQAVLDVDGEARPVMLGDMAAGAVTDVALSVTLDKPGQHTLKFSLPDDAMPGDNARFLSLNVRQRLELNLVDGRFSNVPFESAGDYFATALLAGQGTWHVQRIADTDPQAAQPAAADLTVIADAAVISDDAATQYEKLVRQGMGLIIFAGDQTDPTLYNQRLYRNGQGLLPARLEGVVDSPARGLTVEGFADSPLIPLAKLAPAALARISTRRLMAVDLGKNADPAVRVLARWSDPEAHPAAIEKRLGRGRVLLWTVSADRQWSDWPVDATYVLAMRSAALSAAWPDSGDDNLTAGHAIAYHLPEEKVYANLRITTPDDPTPQPIAIEGSTIHFERTYRAGVYTVGFQDASGHDQAHQLAVSFDKTASDLEAIGPSQLENLLGELRPIVTAYQPGELASPYSGREIWRALAFVALGMLVVESFLAFWVGREK